MMIAIISIINNSIVPIFFIFVFIALIILFSISIVSKGNSIFSWARNIEYDSEKFKHRELAKLIIGKIGLRKFFSFTIIFTTLYYWIPSINKVFKKSALICSILVTINLFLFKGLLL
ncbi:MAG: hypothetical protein N2169_04130 [bacterium]|nr:hypothetical protein [bacterium]